MVNIPIIYGGFSTIQTLVGNGISAVSTVLYPMVFFGSLRRELPLRTGYATGGVINHSSFEFARKPSGGGPRRASVSRCGKPYVLQRSVGGWVLMREMEGMYMQY